MAQPERAPDSRSAEGESIGGRVTDLEGAPLPGVLVEASPSGGGRPLDPEQTDADGRFRFEGLSPGRYDLRFELDRATARAAAVPAGTDQVRIRLARPQGILIVVTTPPRAEEPAAYHYVLERETPGGPVREHAGRSVRPNVLVRGLPPGRYALTVAGGGYAPVRVEGIEVTGASAPEVVAALSALGATIEGRVIRGAAGVEAMVAWRRLEPRDPWPRTETSLTTGADGKFVLRGLPAGRYLVSGALENGSITDVSVLVTAGTTVPIEVRLG